MPDQVYYLFGAIFLVGACGAAFTFGVAVVCRWLKWAPVTINVVVNHQHGDNGE